MLLLLLLLLLLLFFVVVFFVVFVCFILLCFVYEGIPDTGSYKLKKYPNLIRCHDQPELYRITGAVEGVEYNSYQAG